MSSKESHEEGLSETIQRIVRREFPEKLHAEVFLMLKEYGKESCEREVDRVRMAMLKMANGTLEGLKNELSTAKSDYRDVLAYAEYPQQMRKVDPMSPPSEEALREIMLADLEQHQRWLK
jgi:hypothetical protein